MVTSQDSTTDLAMIPGRPTPGAAVYEPVEGVVLARDDMKMPWLALAQDQTSVDGVESGHWYRRDLEQHVDDDGPLEVVPIAIQVTQTYWGTGGFERDRKPTCYSDNGLTAAFENSDGVPTAYPGAECAKCPKMPTAAERFGAQRPARDLCGRGHKLLLMDATTLEVYMLRLTSFSNKFALIFSVGARKNVYALGSTPRANNRGHFYEMTAKKVRELDEGDKDLAEDYFRSYGHVVRERVSASDTSPAPTEPPNAPAEPVVVEAEVVSVKPMPDAADGTGQTMVSIAGGSDLLVHGREAGHAAAGELEPGMVVEFRGSRVFITSANAKKILATEYTIKRFPEPFPPAAPEPTEETETAAVKPGPETLPW
jgi:hypothetical protein